MKLLVTGGCGYKGSVLVPLLLADGHEVLSVDTQWFGDHLPEHQKLTNLQLDIRDTDAIPLDGVEAIIFTDISRDGMMNGLNLDATVAFARQLTIPVIASGGVTNLDDIRALCAVESEGIAGAVTGRAIYEGSLDLRAAQKLADELSTR